MPIATLDRDTIILNIFPPILRGKKLSLEHCRARVGALSDSGTNPAPFTPSHGHGPLLPSSLLVPALRVSDHMDLGPSELVGRSCYQFVHGQDATRIRQSHLDRENPSP